MLNGSRFQDYYGSLNMVARKFRQTSTIGRQGSCRKLEICSIALIMLLSSNYGATPLLRYRVSLLDGCCICVSLGRPILYRMGRPHSKSTFPYTPRTPI